MNKKAISTAIIFILLVLNNIETDLKKRIAFLNYDFYQKIFIESFSNNNVVIVDIDEKSIEQIGQFPWRRDVYSKIINNLKYAKVKVIAFDIFFSEEDNQNPQMILKEFGIDYSKNKIIDSDQLFLDAIKESNVVLPVVGARKNSIDNKLIIKANIVNRGEDPLSHIYKYEGHIISLDKFNEAAKGLGSISIIDSEDGILRSVPMLLNINNQLVPSLSMETIRLFNDQKSYVIETDVNGIQNIKTRTVNFKTDENALMHVKYKELNSSNYISASEIYNNNFDNALLEGKIVLIGSSAQGIFDLVKTSTGLIIPGVQVHANIIENVLANDFIKINLITKIIENIVLIFGLLFIFLITNYLKPTYSILYFILGLGSLFLISIIFYKQNYFIEIYNVIILQTILFVVLLYRRFVEENKSSLENEKKQLVLKKEREIAGEVQKKLFPSNKDTQNYVYAVNIPAKDVSGDYYDYIKVSEEEIYFTLADVSGKGIKAGMLMANASSVFKSLSKLKFPINELALNVNNQVKESSYKGMFITAVIGKINIVKKEIEFVNFGHESIMVLDNENNFSYIKASHPPLGFMPLQSSSLVKTSMLDMNDKKIFIYTDGVTEGYIKDQDELTVKGLEDLILKNKSMNLQEVIHYVTNLLNNRDVLRDDITMMGLEINKAKK